MTELETAFTSLKKLIPNGYQAETGIILGSGLNGLTELFEIDQSIDYSQLDDFPKSTAPGHKGCLHLARHKDKKLLIFEGRLHIYEGWTAQQSAMLVRLAKLIGVRNMVITNAVGALNSDFKPSDIMLVTDHFNFTGHSPLRGQNDEAFGDRFPDMSEAYNAELKSLARVAFKHHSIALREGIYAGVAGPELETSAERRFLRLAGCDAVGMSLIMETIAAVHCGIKVLGIAAVANSATGGPEQQPDTIEAVFENVALSAEKIAKVLPMIIEQI